jgi:hypothetical protein
VFVYQSVLHVPLIIRAPRVRPARVGSAVRLVDVMPTVLDLLDVRTPATDGVSTVDVMMERRDDLGLQVYAESRYPERFGWNGLRSLRDGRFKYIDAPRPELYDLAADPVEEVNLYDSERARAQSLRTAVERLAKGVAGSPDSADQPRPSILQRQQLESLGYVAAGAPTGAGAKIARPDPKDCMRQLSNSAEQRSLEPSCGWWPMLNALHSEGRIP